MKKKPPRPTKKGQKPEGKTLVAVFTEKAKQKKVPAAKQDRYTSVDFLAAATEALDIDAFEKKADLPKPQKIKKPIQHSKPMMTTKNIIKEPEEKQPKSNYPGPRVEDPQPGPVPANKGETKNERILRILRNSRKRLQSQGMPELDVELDELIKEVEEWVK